MTLTSRIQVRLVGLAIGTALAASACSAPVTQTTPDAANSPAQPVSSAQPAASTAIASAPVKVRQPAPNFTAVDSNGKSHQLSDFKGKTVVLEWTNHQCPFVRKHYESNNMQKTQKQATAKGVVWLSIISSAPGQQGNVNGKQANTLITERKASPTAVLLDPDGKVGRLYSARTTPHMFVIVPDGTLAYMGAIDSISSSDKTDVPKAKNYVSAAVEQVLKGQPVTTQTTQPYGCTVKYAS